MHEAAREVWIIIPAYHEAPMIAEVVKGVKAAFPNVVVVDDGSRDETSARAYGAGAHVVRHPVNLGQGAALQTGIDYALRKGAGYIATFDADGQHDIADVARMLDRLRSAGADVALGSRFAGKAIGIGRGRRLLLSAAVFFTRVTTGLALTDSHNGLRVLTRRAASLIELQQNRMAHASEILEQIARHKLSYVEVGNTVIYTEYSRAKGQRASNAVNILVDLILRGLTR